MDDVIKKRIERILESEPRFTVERQAMKEDHEAEASRFSAHVTSELERHKSEMFDDRDAVEADAHPGEQVHDFGGLRTPLQLEKHIVERIRTGSGAMKTLDFTVPIGTRFISPPYDTDWSQGGGTGWLGHLDGKAFTITGKEGFSAAGIGFVLNTNEPVLASITPQGTYEFNSVAFKDLPFSRSRGGMGITIYTDGQQQPTLSRQPVLWSLSGIKAFEDVRGSGRIADAASPAFGFGTVPLAPALLNMVPGSRYLVWVWCWQVSRLEDNNAFTAFLGFNMPAVTIFAGPTMSIH